MQVAFSLRPTFDAVDLPPGSVPGGPFAYLVTLPREYDGAACIGAGAALAPDEATG